MAIAPSIASWDRLLAFLTPNLDSVTREWPANERLRGFVRVEDLLQPCSMRRHPPQPATGFRTRPFMSGWSPQSISCTFC